MPRAEFARRFRANFFDPAFDQESEAIDRLETIAWEGYEKDRKWPRTAKAGPGFHNPDFDLPVQWRATRDKLIEAERRQKDPGTHSRVLVVCGSSRNDGTCPGEVSKTWRLAKLARETLERAGIEVDFLDLSRLASDFALKIHPCKACVSTAQPLCHWPCSCYPNHAFNQVNDWMAEIYERWVSAHGVILVTPTNWYHTSSSMKLMIDRLVCADGGNPDPTLTNGKDVEKAKELELAGWPFPKHLAGRVYGVVVHGDVAGIEETRYALCDWLDWMGFIDAGIQSRLDRYIGYYQPYATSHEELDRDTAVQEEVRNVARAVANAVGDLRAGMLSRPDAKLERPRPK
jgi:multimeric flavodoxin WrbA